MKILHVIAEMGVGGAETMVLELVQQGEQRHWQSAVASAGGPRVANLEDIGTQHFVVPHQQRRAIGAAAAAAAMRPVLRSLQPDVILAHNIAVTVPSWISRQSLAHRTKPVLVSVFHGVAARDYWLAAKILNRLPDHVVTVSESIRVRLAEAGMRRRDFSVIPNAVAVRNGGDRHAAREKLGYATHETIVTCVARLVPQKRHDLLLRAWAAKQAGGRLIIVGDGPLRASLNELAIELEIQASVDFLGIRDDVHTILAASDIATLSSDWEGMPVAVLESMAAGLPFVGTDVDGIREVVSGASGMLVPPGDIQALAQALDAYMLNAGRRAQAGRAGAEVIASNFNVEAMASEYELLFQRLLHVR